MRRTKGSKQDIPLIFRIPFLYLTQSVLVTRGDRVIYRIICRDGFWKVFSLQLSEELLGVYCSYELAQAAILEDSKK